LGNTIFILCWSYFKIHVDENGKRSIAKRLFKGEAYRPYWLRYNFVFYKLLLYVFCSIVILRRVFPYSVPHFILIFFCSCFDYVYFVIVCWSRFKIRKAEHGKRSIAKRLFKGEAYRPYRLRYKFREKVWQNIVKIYPITDHSNRFHFNNQIKELPKTTS
jgi:hypothetical protein